MYENSINVRWKDGEMSPAEKYDMAFNGWEPPEGFMDLKPYKNGNCADFDKEYYDQLGPLASHISDRMEMGRPATVLTAMETAKLTSVMTETVSKPGLPLPCVPAAMREDRPLNTIEYNGAPFM